MTNAEFVPPKPKEFDNTVLTSVSTVFAARFKCSENSSGFSKLMFGATKLCFIIMMLYTISEAPAIQHSCPVIDFVLLMRAR